MAVVTEVQPVEALLSGRLRRRGRRMDLVLEVG